MSTSNSEVLGWSIVVFKLLFQLQGFLDSLRLEGFGESVQFNIHVFFHLIIFFILYFFLGLISGLLLLLLDQSLHFSRIRFSSGLVSVISRSVLGIITNIEILNRLGPDVVALQRECCH